MPETLETAITSSGTENSVIAQLAERAAARTVLHITDRRIGFILEDGQRLEEIDLEPFDVTPARKDGAVTLTDASGFVTYVNRHSVQQSTTLWGNVDGGTITAVLDDHSSHAAENEPGVPGWGKHRATLRLQQTADWKHWLANDGKLLTQDAFAEHIEDGVDAIRNPDAATMLEIAQHFHAKQGASVSSGKRLSGEIQFSFEEQVTAKAGAKGQLEIPDTFTLGLAPFEGNDPYSVTARLRFRLADGRLALGYRLARPDKIRRAAFDDIVTLVTSAADFPVMAGTIG